MSANFTIRDIAPMTTLYESRYYGQIIYEETPSLQHLRPLSSHYQFGLSTKVIFHCRSYHRMDDRTAMPSNHQTFTSRASLLGLPWELRNQIYRDYFTVKGGYVYDGDADKLVNADGGSIDVSLRHTCRSVAHETKDYPFSLNSITFSTIYRKDWQKQAAYVKLIVPYKSYVQRCLLFHLRLLVTPDMYEHSIPSFARYMPSIKAELATLISRNVETLPFQPPWRDAHDRLRVTGGFWSNSIILDRAIAHVLKAIANRYPQEFLAAIDQRRPGWSASHSVMDFFDRTLLPWEVPSLARLTTLAEEWQLVKRADRNAGWYEKDYVDTTSRGPIFQYRRKHYFTAASMAIRFLNRLPEVQRLGIRNLVINEDRASCPRAECHPVGLIPFCKENRKLHIDHRINLWRNFILKSDGYSLDDTARGVATTPFEPDRLSQTHQVFKLSLTRGFVEWVVNTVEILEQGMPRESYTLTLDGGPDLNYSTHMFNTLMKRAVIDLTSSSEVIDSGIFAATDHPDYPLMTRPSMTEISPTETRSSLLQCNFTLDQPWDYRKLVEEDNIRPRPLYPYIACSGSGSGSLRFDISTPLLHLVNIKLEFVDRRKIWDSTDESMRKYGDERFVDI